MKCFEYMMRHFQSWGIPRRILSNTQVNNFESNTTIRFIEALKIQSRYKYKLI